MNDGHSEAIPAPKAAPQEVHVAIAICINPELDHLRQLVAGGRAKLAAVESDFTREQARVLVMRGALFRLLRAHYQKRDSLLLLVDFRHQFLRSLECGDQEQANQAEVDFEKAKSKTDTDYQEAAATVAEMTPLTSAEVEELSQLWKRLVKLYHPDRFATQPDKLDTYHKLTATINRAKGAGDITTLREIAENPHGFILRQGWQTLDFSDEAELGQLQRLYESLEIEISAALEALNILKQSSDYELCQRITEKPVLLDELAAEKAELLTKESVELEKRARQLAEKIELLSK